MTVPWLSYNFDVYDPLDTVWNDVSGVYIFAGINSLWWLVPQWVPLYVGKAESFRNRVCIPQHEKWTQAAQLGATHVHAMVVPLAGMRAAIEQELIAALQPPLNVQHRSPWAELAQAVVRDRRSSQRNQGWSLADLFQPPHNSGSGRSR